MGKKGNQSKDFAQNKTLLESNRNGVKVYLFEKFSDQTGFVFRGQVKLIAEPYTELQSDEDKLMRTVYMFPLKLLNQSIVIGEEDVARAIQEKMLVAAKEVKYLSLEEIAKKAKQAPTKSKRKTSTVTYNRNPYVSAYVKKRANGKCELCEQPAQFNDKEGNPYLECHHIEFLSQGGHDIIENCVALCVVCHKKAHILDNPDERYKMMKKAGFVDPLQDIW